MNVEITREEYALLLDLIIIASAVLTDHKDGDARTREHEKVIQKIYALADAMGQGSRIVHDADLGKYVPASDSPEPSLVHTFLDEYADETFWHELIFRFTERDVARQVGGFENLSTLPADQRFDLETPIEERYMEEFSKHGIDRLEVVAPAGGQFGMMPKTSD
ncbi:MAG TPA: hypothetical protein VL197_11515 [Nitrospirota bacterium]|nr:hypothetical protein [Nitrospirota bacterium]